MGAGQIAHFERRLNTGTGWSSSGFWVDRKNGHHRRGASGPCVAILFAPGERISSCQELVKGNPGRSRFRPD